MDQEMISVANKQYLVKELPLELQGKINVYNKWETELAEARIRVVQLEMAISVISKEISHDIVHREENTTSTNATQQELDLS